MRRVVLDSFVVISAFRKRRGACSRVLALVAERRVVPLATPALFLEHEEVMKRPEQLAASALSLAEVDAALASLAAAVEPVEMHFAWRPQLTNADDEIVPEAAVNARADALVTHNFATAAARSELALLRPAELLDRTRP